MSLSKINKSVVTVRRGLLMNSVPVNPVIDTERVIGRGNSRVRKTLESWYLLARQTMRTLR